MLSLEPGQAIAIIGATGTLGGYLVQLAKKAGLVVIVDTPEKDLDLLLRLGADTLVPRGADAAERIREIIPAGVDGLVDSAIRNEEVFPALKDGGVYVSVRRWVGEPQRDIRFKAAVVASEYHSQEKHESLWADVENGQLTPRVAMTFPAEEAVEAHRRLEAGGIRGRIVLTF